MKYVINVVADIEEILVDNIKHHLYDEVRFRDVFPNFDTVRVSGTHPFVYLLESTINERPVPTGLFPSITIIDDNDQKDPELNVATIKKIIEIESAEVSDIEDNEKKYIISKKDWKKLVELTKDDSVTYSEGMTQRRRSSMVVEVWSRNPRVKNRLYDIARNYLVGSGRFYLNENYDIVIDEVSINGQKSGNYNYDFGYVLYGGILRFEVAYVIGQYIVDTELSTLDGIIHYNTEVHSDD